MTERVEFRRGVVRPIQCLRGGWELVKDEYWLFLALSFVAMFIASIVPLGILMGAMMCGLYLCLFSKMRGQPVSFDTLWLGFDYFVPGLIATLLMLALMMGLIFPFQMIFVVGTLVLFGDNQAQPSDEQMMVFAGVFLLLYVILIVAIVVVHTFVLFVYPLLVDRKLKPVQAFVTSVKAAWGNLGGILGLLLSMMVLSLLGLCACFIGGIFLFPVYFAAVAVAYREVFPELQAPQELPEEMQRPVL